VISLKTKGKTLLIVTVIALIIIGLSYAEAMSDVFRDQSLRGATLIELVPQKCRVLEASEGVEASVEFNRDEFGNIADRTFVRLIAENVYGGANVSYRIVAKNISTLPLSVDNYTLEVNGSDGSLADLLTFSGRVKIYRYKGREGRDEYYDLIGSFSNVNIEELADHLTNIMKYRKIDINEEIAIELDQQFEEGEAWFGLEDSLSYVLVPTFIQYFPKGKK
jgi:hypothetical protein